MTKDATVFLCVGAAKSGTTWLYHQIRKHPLCQVSSIKEIHYFNSLEWGCRSKLFRKNSDALKMVSARIEKSRAPSLSLKNRFQDLEEWVSLLRDPSEDTSRYLDFLKRGMSTDTKLVADFTPAYSLLPASRLGKMAHMAKDVRFVYLMRDPLSRLWSNVRMVAGRETTNPCDAEKLAEKLLLEAISGSETSSSNRSDYIGALRRLNAAVPRGNLCVMFYEDLMTETGLEKLGSFLGIGAIDANFDHIIHKSVEMRIPTELRILARGYLAPQYEYVSRTFASLPEAWLKNMSVRE